MAKSCHTGPKKVFELNQPGGKPLEIWAGSVGEITGTRDWRLVISLSAASFPNPVSFVQGDNGEEASAFFSPSVINPVKPPQLKIEWPDMRTPSLGKAWWTLFLSDLVKIEGKVGVHCQGGHGRTGTFLTILGCNLGLIPHKKDPVLWLRKRYCPDAVETDDQLNYIEDMTGRKTQAKERKVWGQSSLGYGGGYGTGGSTYSPPSANTGPKPGKETTTLTVVNGKEVSPHVADDLSFYEGWAEYMGIPTEQAIYLKDWLDDPTVDESSDFLSWYDAKIKGQVG